MQFSEIRAMPSDKGKITVLIYLKDYYDKLNEHLDNAKYYVKIKEDPLKQLIENEGNIINELAKNHEIKHLIQPYKSSCMLLPKFYGTIKIHKDMKLRPITSNAGNTVGSNLNHIANKILSKVFPPNDNHVTNINKLKEFTNSIELKNDYILTSYDAVSMFTNIPTHLVMSIIATKLDRFKRIFNMEGRLVIKILHFILQKCTYFVANKSIYKQKEGLPMGGSVSTICCRIIMDSIIEQSLKIMPKPLSFKIYVDDTFFIIRKTDKKLTLDTLNSIYKDIQFTCEEEENKSINFLNITIKRENNQLITNWYRKPYSSFRLINYYSSHKNSTIMNTAAQFIKNVLRLSDEAFFQENKKILTEILKYNCFPSIKIFSLLQENYSLMRPVDSTKVNENVSYIPMPLLSTDNGEIKQIIYASGNLTSRKLTEAIGSCKTCFVKGVKDKTPLSKQNNVIVKIICQCGLKIKIKLTSFNETGEMTANKICTNKAFCDENGHAFKRITFIKGLTNLEQSNFYIRYLFWINRYRITNKNEFDLPNKHFRDLL